jgi:hypothetical protein
VLAFAAILVALVALAARPLGTDDTWWHLAMGELYAGGDLWPRSDPLLHTTVLRAPVPHEWLFQVGLAALHDLAGFVGLRVFHGWAMATLVLGVLASCVRAGRDLSAAALATLVWCTLSWFRLVQLRPELVSFGAILALYALALVRDEPVGRGRAILVLALFVVWVNAHSLFAIGLGLLVAAALGAALEAWLARGLPDAGADERAGRALRRAAAFAGLALVAGVVTWLNPRGFEQHATFFTESSGGLIWKIQDDFLPWRPWIWPEARGPAFTRLAWALSNALYALFFVAAARAALRLFRLRSPGALDRLDPVHLGLGAAAFVASLVAVRFHWLSLFPLLYLLRGLRATPARLGSRWVISAAALGLACALPVSGGFAGFAAEVAREPEGYRADWLDERYAGSGARFLAETQLEGRLYHPFNLGGFLGYWLAPRLATFIDGRLDHVPADVLDDYLILRRTSQSGPTAPLRERLERWGIDVVFADAFAPEWYAKRHSGVHLRRLPEWILIHASRSHGIYLRRNPRNVENLRRVANYYAARGIAFDPRHGLDVHRALAQAPGWSREQSLVMPNEGAFESWVEHRDPARRRRAREALAGHAWRIGDFERSLTLDGALLAETPEDRDAGFRSLDALLGLGRLAEAVPLADRLAEAHPEDAEIGVLVAWVRRSAAQRSAQEMGF